MIYIFAYFGFILVFFFYFLEIVMTFMRMESVSMNNFTQRAGVNWGFLGELASIVILMITSKQ